MNIPFPIIYPHMLYTDWFADDRAYDEDAELTRMEQANKRWLNSITSKYNKYQVCPKPAPEPIEEADDDVLIVTGNDEAGSETSHDVDEEEMPTTTESPIRNIEVDADSPDESPEDTSAESPAESLVESPAASPAQSPAVSTTDTADLEVETTLWPYVAQQE